MTDDELAQWGAQEHRERLVHIEKVRRGELSMREAQEFARIRRKLSGLTEAQSARAVKLAGSKRRYAEMYPAQTPDSK